MLLKLPIWKFFFIIPKKIPIIKTKSMQIAILQEPQHLAYKAQNI